MSAAAAVDDVSPGKLWGIRRLADDSGRFRMTALDQRPPIIKLVSERRGAAGAADEDIAAVKSTIADALAGQSSAVLVDPLWAYPYVIGHCSPRHGLILTLEDHRFEEADGTDGRKSRSIDGWSVEKIRRIGGDAVKVLAWYRPDAAPEVRAHQEAYVRGIGEDCRRFDIPFVLELLVYPFKNLSHDYLEDQDKRPELVIESVRTFAAPEYGVDIFKLESPIPADAVPEPGSADSAAVQAHFDALSEAAGRPWVMLSAGASAPAFARLLHYAYAAGASGFLAGRAIWWQAFQHFPDLEAMREELEGEATAYMTKLADLTAAAAKPWFEHPRHRASLAALRRGFDLPQRYGGMV